MGSGKAGFLGSGKAEGDLAEEDLVSKAVLDDLKAMLVFCAQSDEHASAEQQIEVATKLEELSKDKHYAGILKPIFVMGTWSAMLGLVAENVNLRKARNFGGGAWRSGCWGRGACCACTARAVCTRPIMCETASQWPLSVSRPRAFGLDVSS